MHQPAMRVLVTGGAGFLGSHVVRSYVEDGASVRVIGRRGSVPQGISDLPGHLEIVELDIRDLRPDTSEAFAGQDLVIHAAAQIRAGNLDERVLQRKVNVDGTRNIIDACRQHGVPQLLYVSTCAAIGISGDPKIPADEQFAFNLDDLDLGYNLTKRAAEQLVLAANGGLLKTIVVNPGYIFGWDGERYRGRDVIERVFRGPVAICTDGGLSIVHIDDVVAGIRQAAVKGRPGQRYILSGENVSFRKIAMSACKISKRLRLVVSIPVPAMEFGQRLLRKVPVGPARGLSSRLEFLLRYSHQYYDSGRARLELGYETRPFVQIVADALRD
ncbi:MAG: NAD-dependent epimerase/dehydratase family protein [Alphaproteobacteria bacterium]|mgnify:CR=1 FL=1|nr:NAD-dependent epimerase/dehydratase family protein [Alphaproteobacteria bacterium]